MESYNEALEKARSFVNEIYNQMKTVEMGAALMERLGQPEGAIGFYQKDERILLNDFLSAEQLEVLHKMAVSQVSARMEESAGFLNRLSGNVEKELKPVRTEKEPVPQPKGGQRKTIDEAEVRHLYLEEGKTAKEIAEETGFTCSTITTFLSKKGITKKAACVPEQEGFRGDEKRDDKERVSGVDGITSACPELSKEAVEMMYSTGKKNLAEIAEYYKISKKELYDYIMKNHIRKLEKGANKC